MFDMSRRVFLQIAGLSGVGAAVEAPESSLFSLAPTLGAGSDFVFDREVTPLVDINARAFYLIREGEGPVGYMILRGVSNRSSAKSWTPHGDTIEYRIDLPEASAPGADPLVEFYLAASKLRDQVREDSENIAQKVGLASRNGVVTVTRAYTPIMAFPHPEKGMYLGCTVERFLVEQGSLLNASRASSTRGEVPMVVPGDVQMKYLLLTQEELHRRGMLNPDRHGLEYVLRMLRFRHV
jgi:hypothetical protein